MQQIMAFAIAILIPVLALVVVRALDLYQTGSFKSIGMCFLWGGVAYAGAYFLHRNIYYAQLLPSLAIARYLAPVSEEILKSLVLIYLVRKPNFTYFVDGAIYGFAAGIGFAVFENFEYIMGNPGAGLGTAAARVISANLMHATASALVGSALGLARFRRTAGHFLMLLGGWLLAMLLHGIFNNLNTRDIPGPILIYSAVIGLGGVGGIAAIIIRGLAEQRAWIEEKLGAADRVTTGEAKAVQRLEDIHELLAPIRQMFGEEKGDQIEKLLTLQARLGIKRKTLDKLQDEKMHRAVEAEITGLQADMDQLRRAIGMYIMASVRYLFPEDRSPLYGLLEQRIQERIAARPAEGVKSLFASLGERMTKPPETPAAGMPPLASTEATDLSNQ